MAIELAILYCTYSLRARGYYPSILPLLQGRAHRTPFRNGDVSAQLVHASMITYNLILRNGHLPHRVRTSCAHTVAQSRRLVVYTATNCGLLTATRFNHVHMKGICVLMYCNRPNHNHVALCFFSACHFLKGLSGYSVEIARSLATWQCHHV